MRNLFTLLLLWVAAISTCAPAKGQNLPEQFNHPLLKAVMARTEKPAATDNTRFAAAQNIRVPTTQTFGSWINNQWVAEERTTFTYNTMGLWETATSVELPSGNNLEQFLYTYSSQGMPTEVVIKEWENNAWVNMARVVNTYESGQLKSTSLYVWDEGAWMLFQAMRNTYNYSNGRLAEMITESYSFMSQMWALDERVTYGYTGSNNRPTSIIIYSRQGNNWVEQQKETEIAYVGSSSDRSSYILEERNTTTSTWDKYKIDYQYSQSAANHTATTIETISDVNGTVITPSTRHTFTQLTSGETYLPLTAVAELNEAYDTQTSTWVRSTESKANVTRQPNGDITEIVYQEYSMLTSGFVNTERYLFSNFTTITLTSAADDALALATEVYPNPAQNSLRISLDAGKVRNATLSIYSLTGQRVHEQHSLQATTTVDISSLPKGVYLVRISDDRNAAATRRIVKQ